VTAIKLSRLLEGVDVLEAPPTDPEVTGLCYDSRRLKAGDCFVAVPGTHTDGHRYVETALRDGAVAAVVQRRAGTAWPQVVVPDTRRALALMSSTFFGHPSRDMAVIGVTGTDGKTTTTTMIHQMLLSAARRSAASGGSSWWSWSCHRCRSRRSRPCPGWDGQRRCSTSAPGPAACPERRPAARRCRPVAAQLPPQRRLAAPSRRSGAHRYACPGRQRSSLPPSGGASRSRGR
jgi:hypothetical protein